MWAKTEKSEYFSHLPKSDVIRLIESQNAVVKIVSAPVNSNRCLHYILDQLADPKNKRPTKPIDGKHRHLVLNPKTGLWSYRGREDDVRGQAKEKEYTKKTSVTLLPSDGKIKLFEPKHQNSIGLIFNLNLCDIKGEKYIFPQNAETDLKWWLKSKGIRESEQKVHRSVSLEQLKQELAQKRVAGEIPQWNELLCGLSKKALKGIFAVNNSLTERIRALLVKAEIKEKLDLDLPILIITPQEGITLYDEAWQERDIAKALSWDSFELAQDMLERIRTLNLPKLAKEEKSGSACVPVASTAKYELPFEIMTQLDIVDDVQNITLEYLPLNELLKMQASCSETALTEKVKIDNVIAKNRVAELFDLFTILKNGNYCSDFYWPEKIETEKFHEYQEIMNKNSAILARFIDTIFNDPELLKRPELIERVLAHISHSKNDLCIKKFFNEACNRNKQHLLELFFSFGFQFTHTATLEIFLLLLKNINKTDTTFVLNTIKKILLSNSLPKKIDLNLKKWVKNSNWDRDYVAYEKHLNISPLTLIYFSYNSGFAEFAKLQPEIVTEALAILKIIRQPKTGMWDSLKLEVNNHTLPLNCSWDGIAAILQLTTTNHSDYNPHSSV